MLNLIIICKSSIFVSNYLEACSCSSHYLSCVMLNYHILIINIILLSVLTKVNGKKKALSFLFKNGIIMIPRNEGEGNKIS